LDTKVGWYVKTNRRKWDEHWNSISNFAASLGGDLKMHSRNVGGMKWNALAVCRNNTFAVCRNNAFAVC